MAPGKLVDPFKPGEPGDHGAGIATDKVPAGFYEFLGFPCLLSTEAVRKAVARGVETGLFGYATGRPPLGEDGRYRVDRSRVAFERSVTDDEIGLDSSSLILPAATPGHSPSTWEKKTLAVLKRSSERSMRSCRGRAARERTS